MANIYRTAAAGSCLVSAGALSPADVVFNLNFFNFSTVIVFAVRLKLSKSFKPDFSALYFMVDDAAGLPTEPFLTNV